MKAKSTHLRLLVDDFPACFRFYHNVMGFTPTYGHENDVYADFDTGSGNIALFSRAFMAITVGTAELPKYEDAQDKIALIFGVDDVDVTCKQLETKGVTLVTYPKDRSEWGIRTAHFRDPDNNLIEINSPLHR